MFDRFTIEWHPVDRLLGVGIVLCAFAVTLVNTASFVVQAPEFAGWWVALVALLPALQIATVALWRSSPRMICRLWAAETPLLLMILASSYGAWVGMGTEEPFIVPWLLDAPVLCILALVVRLPVVLGATFLLAAAPPLSALVFLGHVPTVVLGNGFVHLSNVIYIALCLLLRDQLTDLSRSKAQVAALRNEEERVQTEGASLSEFERMIHDDVLSCLAATLRTDGSPSSDLRKMAGSARAALRATESSTSVVLVESTLTTEDAARLLLGSLETSAPDLALSSNVTRGGWVCRVAVSTIGLAAAEAARNAVRHAGGGSAEVTVQDGWIRAVVQDHGPGFDPERIADDHFGVRESILGRIALLDGGSVKIDSAETGTTVVMQWAPSNG